MIADWSNYAACKDDPDALFVEGAKQNAAKQICRSCPVRYECLADALDNHLELGVLGGMTERERRILLSERSDVPSWKQMFTQAEADKKAGADPKQAMLRRLEELIVHTRSKRWRGRNGSTDAELIRDILAAIAGSPDLVKNGIVPRPRGNISAQRIAAYAADPDSRNQQAQKYRRLATTSRHIADQLRYLGYAAWFETGCGISTAA